MKAIQKVSIGVATLLLVAGVAATRISRACVNNCGGHPHTNFPASGSWGTINYTTSGDGSWAAGSGQEIYANLGTGSLTSTPLCITGQGTKSGSALSGCLVEDDISDGTSVHHITSACNTADGITAVEVVCTN